MKNYIYLAALFVAACTTEKESYTHSLKTGGGISTAEVSYYQEVTGVGVTGGLDLMEAATPLVQTTLENSDISINHVEKGNYTIELSTQSGKSTFTEIPEKFINMDADISFSSKVFESFFPEEWAPMKGSDYTTLYIKSKKDNQVFYIKVVATGTNKEIGKYSEDF